MFKSGQNVMFGTSGVCIIMGTVWMDMCGDSREYYVLAPVHDEKSTIYVPIDSSELKLKMRAIISAERVNELINEAAAQKLEWISDDTKRKAFCDDAINGGDRKILIQLIGMLYVHREEQRAKKRRFQIADENYLRRAEKMLNDEFAFVLGINCDEVPKYIAERIASYTQQ